MVDVKEAFRFRHPSSILIAGPSGSGKTVFTSDLILDNKALWPDTPDVVHYCYGVWQDGFKATKAEGVHFHEGIPDTRVSSKWFPKGGLLVLDDLMEEGGHDKRVLDLFQVFASQEHLSHLSDTRPFFAGQICQDHLAQCELRGSLQKPSRSIGYARFTHPIVSRQVARSARGF